MTSPRSEMRRQLVLNCAAQAATRHLPLKRVPRRPFTGSGRAASSLAPAGRRGLAFSEFRGYEAWQLVSISQDGPAIAAILANQVMVEAYRAGVPRNGKPFPDGSRMAKIHWIPAKMAVFPAATVPGAQHDVDFMVKDSKRFADTGGWAWAVFNYEAAARRFTPGTTADKPPQGNDARCGFACHTLVKTRDYVFTDYGRR